MEVESEAIRFGATLLSQEINFRLGGLRFLQIDGHSKIADFANAIMIQENISGCEISVYDLKEQTSYAYGEILSINVLPSSPKCIPFL